MSVIKEDLEMGEKMNKGKRESAKKGNTNEMKK